MQDHWYEIFRDSGLHILDFMHNGPPQLTWVSAIVASTLGARCIVLPLTIRMMRNASKMSALAPKLQELKEAQERLGVPQQERGQAFLALYKKEQVGLLLNPHGNENVFVCAWEGGGGGASSTSYNYPNCQQYFPQVNPLASLG